MGSLTEPVERFEVHLVALDPTRGSEIRQTRPCLVVSPDERNRHIRTVIVAPMTTGGKQYPTRVACTVDGVAGHVVLDQIRTVDRSRLVKRLGVVVPEVRDAVLAALQEMFAR